MDENGVSGQCLRLLQAGGDSFYPICFGVACGLFALEGLPKKVMNDEVLLDPTRDKMLQGSAHLLGLLIWSVQRQKVAALEKCDLLHKLETAEKVVEELKRRRTEDGRANEKVVSIFASREQGWLSERKSMRQHIGALVSDLRILERRRDEEISVLNGRLQEMELALKYKSDGLEVRLKTLEKQVEEIRDAAKHESQEHLSELWRQKSAFIEFVCNQNRLEGELCRALRRAETAKQQLDFVLEEKEESLLMLQNLSIELEKVRKDSEQKSHILSAMLRKAKLDTEEKRRLLKEVKLSKARMKPAEPERWTGSSSARKSLRSLLTKQVRSRFGARGGNSKSCTNRSLIVLGTEAATCSLQPDAEHLLERNGEIVQREAATTECLNKKDGSVWKIDIHAIGVSYKVKRIKQLLVMLERLAGKQGDVDSMESEDQDQMRMKGFLMLLSFLNKQVDRYQTLQEKADDLRKRMHEKIVDAKEDRRTLAHSLEETFQLQRLIVASGQKLMEIQSKISCGFSGHVAEKLEGSTTSTFDMRRVSDNIQCLFREVQRGLEVRVARIIGEYLEGTLAWDGFRSRQQ